MNAQLRTPDSSSSSNDRPGATMPHPIGTTIADDLFTEALRAVQAMVFSAAERSLPNSRFLPKFELARWDDTELAACGALFADAVRAVHAEKRIRRAA